MKTIQGRISTERRSSEWIADKQEVCDVSRARGRKTALPETGECHWCGTSQDRTNGSDLADRVALPSRCSNLIEECFSDVLLLCDRFNDLHETSLPHRASDPQVPSDVSESHGTEAGAPQAIRSHNEFRRGCWACFSSWLQESVWLQSCCRPNIYLPCNHHCASDSSGHW